MRTAIINRSALRGRVFAGVALAATAALALGACGGNSDDPEPSQSTGAGGSAFADLSGQLKASGATFPEAFYQEVVESFKDAAPNVTVTYNGVGSGSGKKEFAQGLNDFAGSDSLVKDTEIPAGTYLYVPTVAAPITVSYNLSGVDKLQLSPETLAKIFQRDIKTWNAPEIAADNPGVTLPNKPITVAHRSDGSGTTNNFTKFLDNASEAWKLGAGDTVAWPADTQAGEKNTGVANLVKNADGGIGYIDMSDAVASGLKFAAVKNKAGKYVTATLDGATAALSNAPVKDDLTYDPLNAPGDAAYPITAPTYLLVKPKYDDANKLKLVKGFITYVLNDGQDLANELQYAKLPDTLKQKAVAQLEKIQG